VTSDHLGPYLLGPNDTPENGIYTGDARELAQAIPDESVDLIFTDPVYDRHLDYVWLADLCVRLLSPGGALLVWSNGRWHKTNNDWLTYNGMRYRYEFASVHHAGGSPMNGRIISKTNRLMWFDLGGESALVDYVPDGHLSKPWKGPKEYKWTKNPRLSLLALRAFEAVTILDPFTGGGTVPAVCKMLGRRYLAFEIDPDIAELARERVRNTQPPLPLEMPEQGVLL
jgi:adenine-specific DNA methylase